MGTLGEASLKLSVIIIRGPKSFGRSAAFVIVELRELTGLKSQVLQRVRSESEL